MVAKFWYHLRYTKELPSGKQQELVHLKKEHRVRKEKKPGRCNNRQHRRTLSQNNWAKNIVFPSTVGVFETQVFIWNLTENPPLPVPSTFFQSWLCQPVAIVLPHPSLSCSLKHRQSNWAWKCPTPNSGHSGLFAVNRLLCKITWLPPEFHFTAWLRLEGTSRDDPVQHLSPMHPVRFWKRLHKPLWSTFSNVWPLSQEKVFLIFKWILLHLSLYPQLATKLHWEVSGSFYSSSLIFIHVGKTPSDHPFLGWQVPAHPASPHTTDTPLLHHHHGLLQN